MLTIKQPNYFERSSNNIKSMWQGKSMYNVVCVNVVCVKLCIVANMQTKISESVKSEISQTLKVAADNKTIMGEKIIFHKTSVA